ncbi:uncharacterized protein LOC113236311 isoform X2 [Hyposmocoma kahamanoa]|uniref:uncharacterized protein LOC113236311 isoform X2 n=1 Tax=Hyposmocoma kahamanoa TaxID=1477025 RepID=UPI000E6D669F|nr:uncharacterized protein LOC113236311 isoform X2 [Hyposmocoma kahamanoa]
MFLQGRVVVVWLSWLAGGVCGVIILLLIICYCRLMPRHQKSLDEQYLKDTYTIKENYACTSQGNHSRVKHAEVQVQRHARPVSFAGDHHAHTHSPPHWHRAPPAQPAPVPAAAQQYASSSMLDELEEGDSTSGAEALKTRSLPAFLRPRPRPLSTDADLHQLYAKVNLSKKRTQL